jgi:DNA-binding CsgD family transcriptional regulator
MAFRVSPNGVRVAALPRVKAGWDSLTEAELKVASLVAQGATNRSAAQRLHVTPHTVKAHLRTAFAKLGINSRAELSKLMDDADHPTT